MTERCPTVAIYTLGCKVSQYESRAIAEELVRRGFSLRDFSDVCDVYVINTCTVTAESDRKSRQVIRRAYRLNPSAKIIVCGCYSQRSPDEVRAMPEVSLVVGSHGKMQIPALALSLLSGEEYPAPSFDIAHAPFEKMCITGSERTRAYVKIEDGCESKCAYCAIPSARGPVRSKPREDVIREVEYLSSIGTSEIVLTGIETGSYGTDFEENYRLADLLQELERRGSARRIRLGSLAPELMGRDFADKVKDLNILAPHFHISLQSGSDNVLRRMRRRYLRKTAIENINRLREYIPNAMFTTDLMVGFPGETEEDFAESLSIVEEAGLLDAHVFAYSRRHSTPASDFPDQVPEDLKRSRSERLITRVRENKKMVLSRLLSEAKELSVIFETYDGGVWLGHSDSFVEVECRADKDACLHGEIVLTRPTQINGERIVVEIL